VVVTATTGDFGYAANVNGGFDTASRVYFSPAGCATGFNGAAGHTAATTLTSSTATFSNVPAAFFANGTTQTLCLTARSTGTPAAVISPATYQLTSTLAPASTALYGNFTSPSSTTSWSTIRQNGATVLIPLVQAPAGYVVRLAITNSAASSRAYSVTAVTESGATATLTGALASGTLNASSLNVIDIPGLLTVTGAPSGAQRSALRMVINAPAADIRAVYQITNISTGAVSNQTLTVEN
jgi:hypothetical protein